jgi:hypothetical protein
MSRSRLCGLRAIAIRARAWFVKNVQDLTPDVSSWVNDPPEQRGMDTTNEAYFMKDVSCARVRRQWRARVTAARSDPRASSGASAATAP